MKRFIAAGIALSIVVVACGGDDAPYGRTCYVPGISYAGTERGLVYLVFLGRTGDALYRAVGTREVLDEHAGEAVTACFDIPYHDIVRVRAWIGVGDVAPTPRCFGTDVTPTSCAPLPTDPHGEIAVALKPQTPNRILVPLSRPE